MTKNFGDVANGVVGNMHWTDTQSSKCEAQKKSQTFSVI